MTRKERDEYLVLIDEERKRLADMDAFVKRYTSESFKDEEGLYKALVDDAVAVTSTVDAIEGRLRVEAGPWLALTPAEIEFFDRWVDDIDAMWETYLKYTKPRIEMLLVVGGVAAAAALLIL
jgi:hypothetical protein